MKTVLTTFTVTVVLFFSTLFNPPNKTEETKTDNVSKQKLNSFSIFPSPAGNKLIVDAFKNAKHESMQISLHQINGENLGKQRIDTTLCTNVNIEDIRAGLYVITLHTQNKSHSKLIQLP